MVIWQYGNMARVKTTLAIDEGLIRQVRVRAARTGRRDSDVLEEALREGLGVLERLRGRARLTDEEALELAGRVVHDVRSADAGSRAKAERG